MLPFERVNSEFTTIFTRHHDDVWKMKYVSNPIIAKLKVLFNWKNEWTPIKKYLTSIYVHLETKFALLLDFIIFFLPAKQDTMIGSYNFRMGVSFGNKFPKEFR